MNGQEAPNALLDLIQRGANYAAPNALSLLMGGEAPPLQNVPDTPGKVPSTQDPRLFGAVAEAANIGQNFIPQGGGAKLGGGMLAALIAPAARKGLAQKGIKAYHGSPHDFDRFDMSKIGTGEGAQAYGHGLYFAENPAVALDYKKMLSGQNLTINGGPFDRDNPSHVAASLVNDHGDFNKAVTEVKGWIKSDHNNRFYKEILQALKGHLPEVKTPGRMYEVNIRARPEEFLDWDRPVPSKTPIREMLADIGMKGTGSPFADVRNAAKDTFLAAQNPNLTGEGAYRSLARAAVRPEDIRPGFDARSPYMATETLRDAGIPGIRYLDQGSRTAGEGTSNYVLFRDDIIDILRKYGLPATAGPLGALMMSGQESQ